VKKLFFTSAFSHVPTFFSHVRQIFLTYVRFFSRKESKLELQIITADVMFETSDVNKKSRTSTVSLRGCARSRVGLLAGSSELVHVELRTHGHRGETAAPLALEVVDDGGVTRNRDGEPPAAVATAAGDDGVGVAGLDAVRRKAVLRRDETEPPRARPSVGRSPAALSGASTASLSTALAAAGAALIAEGSRAL
jgi:hypothetical protein